MSYADVAGLTVAQFLNAMSGGKPPRPGEAWAFDSYEDLADWRKDL